MNAISLLLNVETLHDNLLLCADLDLDNIECDLNFMVDICMVDAGYPVSLISTRNCLN